MNNYSDEMTSMESGITSESDEKIEAGKELKDWKMCDFITINDEIKKLLPDLSEEEYASLYESIEENGFDLGRGGKIVLWDTTAAFEGDEQDKAPEYILVDGHNRYEICMELTRESGEVKYLPDDSCFTLMDFNSLDEVKLWVIRNQLERRNISVYGRFEVFYRNIDILRLKGRKNMSAGGKKGLSYLTNDDGPVPHKVNTRKELANLCDVSEGTVWKFMAIADSEFEDLKEDLRYSRKSADAAYKMMKSRLGGDSEEGTKIRDSDESKRRHGNKTSDSKDLMKLVEDQYQEILALKAQLEEKEEEIHSLKDRLDEAKKLVEKYATENEYLKRQISISNEAKLCGKNEISEQNNVLSDAVVSMRMPA